MESKPTDSELNELLATKVMGWTLGEPSGYWWFADIKVMSSTAWNPCQDYNHLRQVEEALSEDQTDLRARYLWDLAVAKTTSLSVIPVVVGVLRANARQRCEAIAKVVGDEE